MKKKSYIVILSILTLLLILAGLYIHQNNIYKVSINPLNGLSNQLNINLPSHAIDDANTIAFALTLFENKTLVEDETLTKKPPLYQITYHRNIGNDIRLFIVEMTKDQVYFSYDTHIYKSNSPEFVFDANYFSGLYTDLMPANISVTDQSDLAIDYAISSFSWTFKDYNMAWHEVNFEDSLESNSNLEPFVIRSQNDSFRLHLSHPFDIVSIQNELGQAMNNFTILDDKTIEIESLETDQYINYDIQILWNQPEESYKGLTHLSVPILYDYPPSLVLSKNTVLQGELIELKAINLNDDEHIDVSSSLVDTIVWQNTNNAHMKKAYLPTTYRTATGEYTIEFQTSIKDQLGAKDSLLFTVNPREFNIQHLSADPSITASTRNEAAYTEFDTYFDPARSLSNDLPYYDSNFILPTTGRLSTEYGETRYVNGAPTSYRHSGLDIAAPSGQSILATNDGLVTLSRFLTLTGNTIVIDHGSGIFSAYFHLNTRSVSVNDDVSQGQVIGTVGSTGFSTGPHLHFIICYYDQNLEPGYFIYNQPVTYENYKTLQAQ